MSDRTSLNGGKTRPLSEHALAELRNLSREPEPTCGINPGVVDRLTRDDLAEVVMLPSPFKTHRGGMTRHLRITDKGRAALGDSNV